MARQDSCRYTADFVRREIAQDPTLDNYSAPYQPNLEDARRTLGSVSRRLRTKDRLQASLATDTKEVVLN
jgi:hypothetical protein